MRQIYIFQYLVWEASYLTNLLLNTDCSFCWSLLVRMTLYIFESSAYKYISESCLTWCNKRWRWNDDDPPLHRALIGHIYIKYIYRPAPMIFTDFLTTRLLECVRCRVARHLRRSVQWCTVWMLMAPVTAAVGRGSEGVIAGVLYVNYMTLTSAMYLTLGQPVC